MPAFKCPAPRFNSMARPPTSVIVRPVVIDFPDGTSRRLHERWREKLTEAQRRYIEERDKVTKAEYLRILKAFSDLVVRGKVPPD
jgi:hypothetical protein